MKKIFTLILIFSLTMQIFAQDKIEKDVGHIAAKMKYESEKISAIIPVRFECSFNFGGVESFILQEDYIGGSAVLGTQILGGILL
ncbi:P13 family porin [Borreliella bavariensis]|uniref:P13 family porin n=1 Tax=Borreliella bavariensis TaxID=664662 RepID=UPI001C008C93|nr:P13 family porin [Borreliella bavariensis]